MHSNTATDWDGSSDFWNHVNQSTVNNMVDQGIMILTGKSTLSDAWHAILPNYSAGQPVAIKVNFNNTISWGCGSTSSVINALIQPVNAVVRGLKGIGVAEGDVWVYDASNRVIPDYFVNGGIYAVKYFGGCRRDVNWAGGSPVNFFPPAGVAMPGPNKIPGLLVDTAYLINMPIMKNHSVAGVTLSFKHHLGSINNPGGLHSQIFVNNEGTNYSDTYNPLIDLYKNLNIGPKTVLTIGDGIFGCKGQEDLAPSVWSTFGGKAPNSLLFATDPVAIDSVMYDLLNAEPYAQPPALSDNYLRLAQNAGLGVFEHGDPWGTGYQRIDYRKREI
ncbi:DUF362 domain-containing protein [Longilinea arvoryzae]|nr:DUF362 domain-containing protein [Longilinea arvoryzae]